MNSLQERRLIRETTVSVPRLENGHYKIREVIKEDGRIIHVDKYEMRESTLRAILPKELYSLERPILITQSDLRPLDIREFDE